MKTLQRLLKHSFENEFTKLCKWAVDNLPEPGTAPDGGPQEEVLQSLQQKACPNVIEETLSDDFLADFERRCSIYNDDVQSLLGELETINASFSNLAIRLTSDVEQMKADEDTTFDGEIDQAMREVEKVGKSSMSEYKKAWKVCKISHSLIYRRTLPNMSCTGIHQYSGLCRTSCQSYYPI